MLNLFLGHTSIGIRCMVMKVVFNLNDRQIGAIVGSSRSTFTDFMKENITIDCNPYVNSRRNFSFELISKLSIILDLPCRYLLDSQAEYNLNNSFDEYERLTIDKTSLKDLVESILGDMPSSSPIKRRIFATRIIDSFFNSGLNYLYTRVDIRKDFFTIEIHISNKTIIHHQAIDKIKKIIKANSKIYYRDAYMRNNSKLFILIAFNDTDVKVPHYLNDNMLIDNMMFRDDWIFGNKDN